MPNDTPASQQPEMALLVAQRDMHSIAAQKAHLEILLRLAGEDNDRLIAEAVQKDARIAELEAASNKPVEKIDEQGFPYLATENAAIEGDEAA